MGTADNLNRNGMQTITYENNNPTYPQPYPYNDGNQYNQGQYNQGPNQNNYYGGQPAYYDNNQGPIQKNEPHGLFGMAAMGGQQQYNPNGPVQYH